MRVHPAGYLETDHLSSEVPRGEDELGGDKALRDDPLLSVEVAEKEIERADALREAALDLRPLVGGDDAGNQVEREDAVGPGVIAVDREADPLVEKERVRDANAVDELRVGHRHETLVEQAVVGARGSGALEHLIEERLSKVVAGDQTGIGLGCGLGSTRGVVGLHLRSFRALPALQGGQPTTSNEVP